MSSTPNNQTDPTDQRGALPGAYRGARDAAPRGVRPGLHSADLGRKPLGGDGEADGSDEVVLFLIGMRINRLRRFWSWLPVAFAMPRMLRSLAAMSDTPLLAASTWVSGRTVMTMQLWRSAEELGRFARDPAHPHAAAWAAFNRRVAGTADVGIFHETYTVRADQVESLYGNMPTIGLAAAYGSVDARQRRRTTATDRVHAAAGDHELGSAV